MRLQGKRQALTVTLIYFIAAGCWDYFSDKLLEEFIKNPDARIDIDIIKDAGFAILTSCLLYLILRRVFRRWESEAEQRKQAEIARQESVDRLHHSEEQLRLVLEAAADGLWDFNFTTGIANLSPRYWEIIGHPAEESVANWEFYQRLVHPGDWPDVEATMKEHFAGKSALCALEYRIITKGGTEKWIWGRGKVVARAANGSPLRMVGTISDITEQKQAAKEVKRLSQWLLKTQQISKVGGWAINLKTSAVWASPESRRIYGISDSELITLRQIQSFPLPEYRPGLDAAVQKLIADRLPYDIEFQIARRTDGAIVDIHSVAEYNADEAQVVGVLEDITERKRAERLLQEREEQYRAVMESAPDGIFILQNNRFVLLNASAMKLFGVRRQEELLGRDVFDFIHQDFRDLIRDRIVKAMKSEQTLPLLEQTLLRMDGSIVEVEATSCQFRFQGQPALLVEMRDITERKQAEHEIKRQAAFAHFNPNPVLELSPSGEIMYFNAAALQMAGSLGMKHPAEIMPSNTAAIVSDCLATSKPLLRLETRAKDRTISWSFFPVAITQAVHCYAGDVTERKQAEEQMNLQSGALTAAANAIVITDRNGAIEWVNPSFTRLTGYSAEEAIGGNPRLLKSGQHPPSFYATLWSTVRTGNVWHGEMVNKRKDGRLYTEDMTITPVRAADGQIAHFVAIKQDVTDRKELENKLQQVQKMEAIGRLAGGIAHDFNNILAAMFGFGFLLQQDTEGNPAAQESIGEILKAATRAKELVQQILTFSRQREQKRQVIHLDPVIKEAMKFLRASLPANIDIEINLATDAPAVLADSTQIYQVAVNLATNALHAMEGKPGRLTISLDGFRPDESFIRTHSEFRRELYARLTFSDTGHGMDAKTLERVFEPFFTTKAVGKGTGLGLAVVHGIVQSHEGAITVQSEINQGTTFRLYFPAQAAGSLATEPTLAKFARGRGEKILILDDEPALTKALQQILIRLNYHVTSSNCAAEALALFDKDSAQFDLIITDHTMPEMDGLEVARRIHTVCPDLPILLATGFSDSLTPEIRREAGIGELIEKPVSTSVLADIVHRTLMGQKV